MSRLRQLTLLLSRPHLLRRARRAILCCVSASLDAVPEADPPACAQGAFAIPSFLCRLCRRAEASRLPVCQLHLDEKTLESWCLEALDSVCNSLPPPSPAEAQSRLRVLCSTENECVRVAGARIPAVVKVREWCLPNLRLMLFAI